MNTSVHRHREELEDYFLDLLPPSHCREVETHLESCDQCAAIALNLHESWVTLEAEMSPEAYGEAFRESVRQGLLAVLQSLKLAVEEQAALWLEKIKNRTEQLGWMILEAPFGLRPVRVLGGEPESGERPAAPMRPVMVVGREGFPVPEVRIEKSELVIEFRNIGIYDDPPAVFLVSTTAPDQTALLSLSWSMADRAWIGRGPEPLDEVVLAVGPPLLRF
jgi:hypothetical protein